MEAIPGPGKDLPAQVGPRTEAENEDQRELFQQELCTRLHHLPHLPHDPIARSPDESRAHCRGRSGTQDPRGRRGGRAEGNERGGLHEPPVRHRGSRGALRRVCNGLSTRMVLCKKLCRELLPRRLFHQTTLTASSCGHEPAEIPAKVMRWLSLDWTCQGEGAHAV